MSLRLKQLNVFRKFHHEALCYLHLTNSSNFSIFARQTVALTVWRRNYNYTQYNSGCKNTAVFQCFHSSSCCQKTLFRFRLSETRTLRNQSIFSDCSRSFSKGVIIGKTISSDSQFRYFHSLINCGRLILDSKMEREHQASSSTSTTTNKNGESLSGAGGQSASLDLPDWEVAMMNDARQIFKHSVNSVLPKELVTKNLTLSQNRKGDVLTIDDREYELDRNVYVVGFGKAVLGMARALYDLIGQHIVKGVVSIPKGTQEDFKNAGKEAMLLNPGSSIAVREGASNNMPDRAAHEAALEIANLIEHEARLDTDVVIVLISGGGSALLPAPKEPLTLDDILLVTGQMSRAGATINQLNTVRKQLDFLKGGGLAKLAYPKRVVSLILSDIVGDPIDLIASGPTVVDRSAAADCLSIFSQLGIAKTVPISVTDFLISSSKSMDSNGMNYGEYIITNDSTNSLEFTHVQNLIIGSNKIACERAHLECDKLGYRPFVLSTELEGDAKEVGRMFANLAVFITGHIIMLHDDNASVKREIEQVRNCLTSQHELTESKLDEIVHHVENETSKMASKGVCVIAGGETTVTVTGTGKGGRNQEMATSVGLDLDKRFNEFKGNWSLNDSIPQIVFLSAGTDGQDGPTPAAGGVVGLNFVTSANSQGMNPRQYLDDNDSFTLLNSWADGFGLVNTGLTGTNVMDIQLLMVKLVKK